MRGRRRAGPAHGEGAFFHGAAPGQPDRERSHQPAGERRGLGRGVSSVRQPGGPPAAVLPGGLHRVQLPAGPVPADHPEGAQRPAAGGRRGGHVPAQRGGGEPVHGDGDGGAGGGQPDAGAHCGAERGDPRGAAAAEPGAVRHRRGHQRHRCLPGRVRGGLHHGHHGGGRDHGGADAPVSDPLPDRRADEDGAGEPDHHLPGRAGAGAERAQRGGAGGAAGGRQGPVQGDRPAGGGYQRRAPLRHVPGRRRQQAAGVEAAGGPGSGDGRQAGGPGGEQLRDEHIFRGVRAQRPGVRHAFGHRGVRRAGAHQRQLPDHAQRPAGQALPQRHADSAGPADDERV